MPDTTARLCRAFRTARETARKIETRAEFEASHAEWRPLTDRALAWRVEAARLRYRLEVGSLRAMGLGGDREDLELWGLDAELGAGGSW